MKHFLEYTLLEINYPPLSGPFSVSFVYGSPWLGEGHWATNKTISHAWVHNCAELCFESSSAPSPACSLVTVMILLSVTESSHRFPRFSHLRGATRQISACKVEKAMWAVPGPWKPLTYALHVSSSVFPTEASNSLEVAELTSSLVHEPLYGAKFYPSSSTSNPVSDRDLPLANFIL